MVVDITFATVGVFRKTMKKKEIKSNRQQTNGKAETLRIKSKQSVEEVNGKTWLAILRKALRKIDPESAEVVWEPFRQKMKIELTDEEKKTKASVLRRRIELLKPLF